MYIIHKNISLWGGNLFQQTRVTQLRDIWPIFQTVFAGRRERYVRKGWKLGVVEGKERKKIALKIGWLRTEINGRSRKIRVSKWCYSVQKIERRKMKFPFLFYFSSRFSPLCYYDLIGVTSFRVIKMKNKFCCFHSLTSQWIATVVLKEKDIEIFGLGHINHPAEVALSPFLSTVTLLNS